MKKKSKNRSEYDEYVHPELKWKYHARQEYDFFIEIYENMLGLIAKEYRLPWMDNAFAEGELCYVEYNKMRDAYVRLCNRLGVMDEDDDLNIMVDAMEKIQKELCRRFYFLQNDYIAGTCNTDYE